MPTATYIPLATYTLTGSDSQIDFANIPNTYKDLILVFAGTVSAGTTMFGRFNTDSSTSYSFVGMYGNGSATGPLGSSGEAQMYLGYPTTSQNVITIQVMDYSATDKHKTVLSRSSDATGFVTANANRWANTNAINAIRILPVSGSFAIGSVFSLYGIAG